VSIVHVSGRIGRDAEVRNVGDGKVANFSVAENIGFGDNKKTQWWSCALWGVRGEKLAAYLTKGSAVTVCGEVTVREYDGKDGTRKHELQCRVIDVALQGGRENGDARPPIVQTPAVAAAEADPGFNDEIPF
jgi:single-strand DNA-binding protein